MIPLQLLQIHTTLSLHLAILFYDKKATPFRCDFVLLILSSSILKPILR